MSDAREVPQDFPKDFMMGSVGGAQPKLLARKIGERFVMGPTDEEFLERWSSVENAAQRLAEDTLQSMRIGEVKFLMSHYISLERNIMAAGWDLTPKERAWLMRRISQLVDERADETG